MAVYSYKIDVKCPVVSTSGLLIDRETGSVTLPHPSLCPNTYHSQRSMLLHIDHRLFHQVNKCKAASYHLNKILCSNRNKTHSFCRH